MRCSVEFGSSYHRSAWRETREFVHGVSKTCERQPQECVIEDGGIRLEIVISRYKVR